MLKKLISIILCLLMLFTLTACRGNTIATVDGEAIDKGYFNYYFYQLKEQLGTEIGGESWEDAKYEGKSALEYAKERALQFAIEDLIVTKKAEEENIKLTNDDIKNMGLVKTGWIDRYGSKSKFIDQLKSYGVNEAQFDYMLNAAFYKSYLIDRHTTADDSATGEYYNNNIAKVKHILVLTMDPNTGSELADEDLTSAKMQAEKLLEMAKSGEDFDALVAEYTEDQNAFYYVGEGFSIGSDGLESTPMVTEFEITALALEVGEISDIVESDYGYHIIKRYENDSEMFELAKETLSFKLREKNFSDVLNEWKSTMKIIVNESLYNSYK